jgi:thiamine biosynthesis lipoprotein ApbE
VADTAATADALATILGVQQPADAIAEANEKGIPTFIVDCDGRQFRSEPWNQIEVDLS